MGSEQNEMQKPTDFGFSVRQTKNGTWCVYLSHSCGDLDIVGAFPIYGESYRKAVFTMNLFIDQAMQAQRALIMQENHGQAKE